MKSRRSLLRPFIFGIGGWEMDDLRSELKRVGLAPEKKKPKKRSERLSERDWKELMGMNRPTYKRYKGAYRQK